MKLYVKPTSRAILTMDWPDGWRIPVSGEHLLTNHGLFTVETVQWEFEDDEPAVQLRVSEY
jgi:hypothetical protein